MSIEDDDASRAFEEQSQAAGEMLERSLLKAVGAVETELTRVLRAGEADLERLIGTMVEILAKLGAVSGGSAPSSSNTNAAESVNQVAAAVARAVQRGARFS